MRIRQFVCSLIIGLGVGVLKYPFVSLPSPTAWAAEASETQTVEVEGHGATEREAKEDAFRNAIEQVKGVSISSQTVTQNYQVVVDRIRASAEAFISNYQILSCGRGEEGETVLRARITVNTGSIRDSVSSLKILMDRLNNPRFMVIDSHRSAARRGDAEATAAAIGAVHRFLGSKLIEVVDQAQVERLKAEDSNVGEPEAAAQRIAKSLHADIYVTVYGHVERSASVNVKFFESSTGRLLGEDSGYSNATDGYLADQKIAVEQAINSACNRAFETMLGYWKRDSDQGVQIVVVAKGLDFTKKGKFRRLLSSLGKDVKQLSATKGYAEFVLFVEPGIKLEELQEQIGEQASSANLNIDEDATVLRGNRLLFTFK